MKRLKLIQETKLPYAVVGLYSPALLRIEITADILITKKEAKELNDIMGELSKGKALPYMLLANENTQFHSSARVFSASTEGSTYKKAEALIIHTLTHKLLADLYLKINKPKKPCKTFTSEEDGIDWLLSL